MEQDTITMALVEPALSKGRGKVTVLTTSGVEKELFSFWTEELSFTEKEFIGLTIGEGKALFTKKDIAYIQS